MAKNHKMFLKFVVLKSFVKNALIN